MHKVSMALLKEKRLCPTKQQHLERKTSLCGQTNDWFF